MLKMDGNRLETFYSPCRLSREERFYKRCQILSEFGINLPFPYSSQVEGRLRELRTHYGRSQYRVLYYCDENQVFVLLHAFQKRSQKLPKREIRIAMERMSTDQQRKAG